jgi:hypothetical protein
MYTFHSVSFLLMNVVREKYWPQVTPQHYIPECRLMADKLPASFAEEARTAEQDSPGG